MSETEDTAPQQPIPNPLEKTVGGYALGYDVDSWAIRKYRTNDPFTFRRGLDDNVHEYLEKDLGFQVDTSVEDMKLWIMFLSLCIGVGAWLLPMPFNEAKPYILGSIVAYYACVGVVFYIARFLEGDYLLVSVEQTDVVPLAQRPLAKGNFAVVLMKTHMKAIAGFFLGLIGLKRKAANVKALPYRLRIRSGVDQFRPFYEIEADICTNTNSRVRKPEVLATVKQEWSVGDFFDEEGYIYPPSVKSHTDKLLKDLHEKYEQKQKGGKKGKKN